MFSRNRLLRGLRSPNLLFRAVNRLYHRRLYTKDYNTDGVDIFKKEWDNLLILDACRYDMFKANVKIPGRLESRISRGASTTEFLRANFTDRDLRDTVYVTANPNYHRIRSELDAKLHEVVDVWAEEGWNEIHRTVLPETTTRHALAATEEFPDKRLLVHYIQPHYPFLTDAESVFEDSQAFLRPDEPGSWNKVLTGDLTVSRDEVWEAYVQTLHRALPHVEELIEGISGKTVLTADHGNMVGERARPIPMREWGHPEGIYTDHLVRVPWHVVDGERRTIEAEKSERTESDVSDERLEERLADLGYL